MADRFPLIVNAVSQKIEELISGDNLELSGNNIVISGDTGAGKYLTSDGTTVSWGSPGDVYLDQNQTLTNKTFTSCVISGSANTLSNIPNAALSNSTISVNGAAIALGGSVVTPNDNTTYSVSAQDGINNNTKVIRLTAGGSGTGDDDVSIAVGPPSVVPGGSNALALAINRVGEVITISGTAPDADTITTIKSGTGGTAQTGDITIAATGSSTVSQDTASKTITINSTYVDTITKMRATTGQVLNPGNFTFLDGGATTVAQGVDGNGDSTITYTSVDTITRLKGGAAGTLVTGDVEFTGGANVTVSQAGNTISIASVDTNTVTRLSSGANAVTAGDFKFVGTGATSISQATAGGVTTFTVTSVNSDTGASLTASAGLILAGTDFQIKNAGNFSGNQLLKWDSGNSQIASSLISDNGSTVTIGGDLVVDGTQTILNTQTLIVEDNNIELRKGNNLVGTDGGLQVNLETDAGGSVTKYQALQWYESGGYWRGWDGSVERRFVSENETQILTNKTLTSPILTSPTIGAAVATSINGLIVNTTASATLDIATSKILDVNDSLTLTTDNPAATVAVNFRVGGDVAYRSDTLASFSSTTSTQMRGLISDTTGLDKMVFQTNPTILTGITTTSAGFNLVNSGATSILFGGAAGSIVMGAPTGDTTINHDLILKEDLTCGIDTNDTATFNGIVNIENADLLIRGTDGDPMSIGRGGGAVNTNTRVGVSALAANVSGSQNTAFGYQCLFTNNAGASNTALGHRVLRAAGTANNNIGVGKDALLVTLSGSKNIAIGNNAMETNVDGDANVCIGHYAGFDVLGTGNVLIGPADNENSSDVTFRPPNVSGDRQLVIGSGGQAWIRGDSNFHVTLNNNLTVDGDQLIKGNLTVNGTTTTIKSNIVEVTDKAIELAAVVSTQFSCTVVSGSANISAIAPTLGLIPGMEVTSNTAGITVPSGTIIASIATDGTATLSNPVTGSGTPTFSAIGPSDTAAEDGGIIVKGTTDKTFLWRGVDGGVTYNSWLSSEHIDLASGKNYFANGILIASDTNKVIGPTNGGGQGQINLSGGGLPYTLGSAVTGSSLTSVGQLQGLNVAGAINIDGDSGNTTQFSGYNPLRLHNVNGAQLGNTVDMYFTVGTLSTNRGACIGALYTNPGPGNALYFATNPGAVTSNDTLVEGMRITPDSKVQASQGKLESLGNSAYLKTIESGGATVKIQSGGAQGYIGTETNHHLSIRTNDTIVANFTEDGDMMVMHPTNSNGGQILGMISFTSSNNDAFQNQEDCYRINFWENVRSTTSTRTDNANASIRYNASTSDGGDGSIRFANESGTRLLFMNRLGNGGTSGAWNVGSDQRKKDNIATVTDALDKVNQLRGVDFNWKERYGGHADSGVIAQEVESVLPHLVITQDGARDKDDDGNVVNMKQMNYNGLWGVMIEAIKELTARVEELEK